MRPARPARCRALAWLMGATTRLSIPIYVRSHKTFDNHFLIGYAFLSDDGHLVVPCNLL